MCTACLQVFGLYLSTYIVVIISIDRCMAIMDPISKNRGPRRVKIMIAIAWILSAVFSVPQVRALSPTPTNCLAHAFFRRTKVCQKIIINDTVNLFF